MNSSTIDYKDLQLNALLEVTQAVNNNLSEDDLFKIYKFTLLADLRINRLALFTENGGQWRCRVNFGTEQDFTPLLLPTEYLEIEGEIAPSLDEFRVFDSAFPVYHKEKLLAVVFIEAGNELAIENRFLNALTNIILVAIENKRLARKQMAQEAYRRELEIAKKVQNFLFPKNLPKVERLQIEAVYLPHYDVGGDYYDYIQIDANRFLVCIADVSGKGVPAALLMSNFQASLRALVRRTQDLQEIVEELNHSTYVSGNAENFITFFASIYDYQSQSLEYINCGHNEILLYQGVDYQLLTKGTTVLGMFDPLPFIETIKVGSLSSFTLFMYTDGLTETFDEQQEPFEFDRLTEILQKDFSKDIKVIQTDVIEALNNFRGKEPFHDDITMLTCRVVNE
ncbi:MAG: PP2C family protein-serine/threonine phosphatase [Bacteroidota bacterium]